MNDNNFQKVETKKKKDKKKDKKKNKKKEASKEEEEKEKEDFQDKLEFFQKRLPKGAPGRKSFVVIPKEKKVFHSPEATALRKMTQILIPVHIFLLFTDIFIYDFEISSIIFDVIFLWLNFYNFMTINKIVLGIEVLLYGIAVLIALTHMKRVMFEVDSISPKLMYFTQYLVAYPVCCVVMGWRLHLRFVQQHELYVKHHNKTLKGKMKLKLQKAVVKNGIKQQPAVMKRIDSLLYDFTESEESDDFVHADLEAQYAPI